jgi:hypothetical protein
LKLPKYRVAQQALHIERRFTDELPADRTQNREDAVGWGTGGRFADANDACISLDLKWNDMRRSRTVRPSGRAA